MSRKVNLFITQGEDFEYPIEILNANSDPFEVTLIANTSGSIRKSFISANAVSINVAVATGILTLRVPATATANMVPGRYIYDIKFVSTTNAISKPVSGIVTIAASPTR